MGKIDWSELKIGESRVAEGYTVSRCREYHRAWQYGYKAGKCFRAQKIGKGLVEIWRVPCEGDGKAKGYSHPWSEMEVGEFRDFPGRTTAESLDYQRARMYGYRTGKKFRGKAIGDGKVRIWRVDDEVKPSHYPWCTMKVGQSIDVPGNDAGLNTEVERARRYGRRNGMKFVGRTLPSGERIRITRVK